MTVLKAKDVPEPASKRGSKKQWKGQQQGATGKRESWGKGGKGGSRGKFTKSRAKSSDGVSRGGKTAGARASNGSSRATSARGHPQRGNIASAFGAIGMMPT